MNNLFIKVRVFFLVLIFFTPIAGFAESPSSTNALSLKELVEKKNVELQQIQIQREAVEKNLEEVNKSGGSLKKELQVINSNISQLNLSVKANTLTLERLDLEIDSLKIDTEKIEEDINQGKLTIAKLLVELQKKDRENFLITFLKNKSLNQSIAEAQTIVNLNGNLTETAGELREFQYQLSQKLTLEEQTKRNKKTEQVNLLNRQYIVQDQKSEKQKLLEQTKNQEKIYREQIAELEKKQQAIGDELEKIENQLRTTFDSSLLPIKRPGVLGYPVGNRLVTQPYGKTKFAERAYKTKFHNGIDFQASIGTPVFAAASGKIKAVGNNGRLQYGKFVLIEHENNLTTLYAHLSRYVVQNGDKVNEGDLIGYSGNTGYSTGPHLHLTVYWAPSVTIKSFPGAGIVPVGITIDPADYL